MTVRTVFSVLILATAVGTISLACAGENEAAGPELAQGRSGKQVGTMKIRMDVEGTVITATLADNATSRDFVSLLPLTLTLKAYEATEKISDLPKRLFTEGAPPGSDPSIGDITALLRPSAFMHRGHRYRRGLDSTSLSWRSPTERV